MIAGGLCLQEFRELLLKCIGVSDQVQETFERVDINKDDQVSVEELELFLV